MVTIALTPPDRTGIGSIPKFEILTYHLKVVLFSDRSHRVDSRSCLKDSHQKIERRQPIRSQPDDLPCFPQRTGPNESMLQSSQPAHLQARHKFPSIQSSPCPSWHRRRCASLASGEFMSFSRHSWLDTTYTRYSDIAPLIMDRLTLISASIGEIEPFGFKKGSSL